VRAFTLYAAAGGSLSVIEPAVVDAVTEAGTAENAAVISPASDFSEVTGEVRPVAVITPARVCALTGPAENPCTQRDGNSAPPAGRGPFGRASSAYGLRPVQGLFVRACWRYRTATVRARRRTRTGIGGSLARMIQYVAVALAWVSQVGGVSGLVGVLEPEPCWVVGVLAPA
jgi:hypothetical protein